jgi:hypothetical protein
MTDILHITYAFPPTGGPGQYNAKFALYLKAFNYNCRVLAPKLDEKSYHQPDNDDSFIKSLDSAAIKVTRVKGLEDNVFFNWLKKIRMGRILSFFLIPDVSICWLPKAVLTGLKIIKDEDIRMIYTCVPPHSVNLAGLVLAYITKLPWVVMLTDPWTDFYLGHWPTKLHYRLECFLEKLVLRRADRIIVVHPDYKRIILEKNLQISESKIEVVSLGYDEHDFDELTNQEESKPGHEFIITYVGRFYWMYNGAIRNRVRLRDRIAARFFEHKISNVDFNSATPYYFLKGLRLLLDKHQRLKGRIKVRFIGSLQRENAELIREFGLESTVRSFNYIPHRECLKMVMESDSLLYIICQSSVYQYAITSKLYEYLRSKKPVLALVPEGDAKKILVKSGLAVPASPDDPEDIADTIFELYRKWENNSLKLEPDNNYIGEFEYNNLARQLAGVFDGLSKV